MALVFAPRAVSSYTLKVNRVVIFQEKINIDTIYKIHRLIKHNVKFDKIDIITSYSDFVGSPSRFEV